MPQKNFISNSATQNQNPKRAQRRRDALRPVSMNIKGNGAGKNTPSFFFAFLCAFASLRESFCFYLTFNRIAWFGIVVLFFAAPLRAGETVPYTLAQRTQKAEIIVVAEVESMSSNWDDDGREIYTYITLRVMEKIKGNVEGNEIVLRHLGGVIGNIESRVSGMPQFSRHEKVLVFLGRYPASTYFGVMDWLEGKKTIQYNAAGQEMVRVGTRGESNRLLKEYIGEIQALLKQK
jgi:hypothetical protein